MAEPKKKKKAVLSSDSKCNSQAAGLKALHRHSPAKRRKKKIKLPLDDLTSLPSEEEYGDELH